MNLRMNPLARFLRIPAGSKNEGILEPIREPETVMGKNKGLLKGKNIEQIEGEQERFGREGRCQRGP